MRLYEVGEVVRNWLNPGIPTLLNPSLVISGEDEAWVVGKLIEGHFLGCLHRDLKPPVNRTEKNGAIRRQLPHVKGAYPIGISHPELCALRGSNIRSAVFR